MSEKIMERFECYYKIYYNSFLSLHHHLTEHINAEIVLGTITDTKVAQEWLKSTFLYVRMCSNPKYYGKRIPFLMLPL